MKRFPYFLIFLLFVAQVDDTWAVDPVFPSAPLFQIDDDDEYIPQERRTQVEEQHAVRRAPLFSFRIAQSAGRPSAGRCIPSALTLTIPFAPHSLYLFMSIQI
jgi:hypothetical protein